MSTERESKAGIDVEQLKCDELYGKLTTAAGEDLPYSDDNLLRKLYAAEDYYERDLNIRLQPTRVFSSPEKRTSGAGLDPSLRIDDFDPIRDLAEPAYDYDRQLWAESRWALIKLRHRPVKKINQVTFTWVGKQSIWKVPEDWIQADLKFGTINIVPTSGPVVTMAFSAWFLSVLAGGRGLPHSLFIDYETGFSEDELCYHHQDLLEGIRLRTLLSTFGLLSTIRSGGVSGDSIGIDGLSHTRSYGGRFGAYAGEIEMARENERAIRDNWRRREQGVPGGVHLMAIEDRHRVLDSRNFDEEIVSHGTPALWRKARMCPCIKERTGQPEVGCAFCDELGSIWGDDKEIKVLAPGRKRNDDYGLAGAWMDGMVLFTFPTDVFPGHLDQIELLNAAMVVNNEHHVRGATDRLGRSKERLRLRHAIDIEFCEAIVGDDLVDYKRYRDFNVNDEGDILWNAGGGPPEQAQYTLRYTAKPIFVIWSPTSRDEHGAKMPYRALAKRLDFFDPKSVGEA